MDTKKIWLAAVFICIFPVLSECKEEGYNKIGDVSVPDSMEVVKEGDVNVLVPKGEQLKKESSFLVKEASDEYASRRFIEMEGYFNNIKQELEAQKEELKKLKELIENLMKERNTQKASRR